MDLNRKSINIQLIMKRVILSALLSLLCIGTFAQNQYLCRTGISFEMSKNSNWGKGRPVIISVIPYSAAEQAGLKTSDIITAIDGADTYNLSFDDVQALLNPENKNEMLLSIKNLENPDKSVLLKKECKRSNAITEDQLASSFCMYSLESNSERQFIAPFKTFSTPDAVDFANFKTFAFSAIDENNSKLEKNINKAIEKALESKGLRVDVNNPDLLVQTFYFFDKNPNYKGTNKLVVDKPIVYRFNPVTSKMDAVPFLNISTPETEAQYLLQLGFRLIDQKEKSGRILWECESNELLDGSYRLDEYAESNVPLMIMQYPYVKYTRNVPFATNQKTFNYTGLQYDINNLSKVVSVDRNSPAYEAGLRTGDEIISINGNNIDYDADELSAAYKEFITKTMKFRDPHSQFSDANGFKRCMYWSAEHYSDVAALLKKGSSRGVFSYLYYYAPYINQSGNNICNFEIKRGKENIEVSFQPSIRRSIQVELK